MHTAMATHAAATGSSTRVSRRKRRGTASAASLGTGRQSRRKRRQRSAVLLQEAFEVLDANGSGGWSFDEFEALCASDDAVAVAELFAVLDADGSGEVDFAEVQQMLGTNARARALATRFSALEKLSKHAARSVRPKKKKAKKKGSKKRRNSQVRRKTTMTKVRVPADELDEDR